MQSINSRRIHRLQSCARAPQLVLRVLVLRVLGSVLVVLCGRVCGRVGVLVLCGRIGVLVLGVVLLRRILRRFGSLYTCIYTHTHTCVCVCVCVYQMHVYIRCIHIIDVYLDLRSAGVLLRRPVQGRLGNRSSGIYRSWVLLIRVCGVRWRLL